MKSGSIGWALVALAIGISACTKDDLGRKELPSEQFVETYTQIVLAATDTSSEVDSVGRLDVTLNSPDTPAGEALDSSISKLHATPRVWLGIISKVIGRLERVKARRDSLVLEK